MKLFSKILAIVICMSFLFSATSCVVLKPKDHAKHKDGIKTDIIHLLQIQEKLEIKLKNIRFVNNL